MLSVNDAPSAVVIVKLPFEESYVNPVTPATETLPMLSTNPEALTVITGIVEAEPHVPAYDVAPDLIKLVKFAVVPDNPAIIAESTIPIPRLNVVPVKFVIVALSILAATISKLSAERFFTYAESTLALKIATLVIVAESTIPVPVSYTHLTLPTNREV